MAATFTQQKPTLTHVNRIPLKEKDAPRVTVTSEDEESTTGHHWNSGYTPRLPWISLICLCIILGLAAAVGIVLGASDGKDVAYWCSNKFRGKAYQITPNVWISIFIFIAGKLLALSFGEAVAIAWWVRAINGRTLRQLHQDYESGRSIISTIKSPKAFSFIGLGTIAFTAFAGLGAVLQKATSSAPSTHIQHNVPLTTSYAPRLPWGFTASQFGAIAPGDDIVPGFILQDDFRQVTQEWAAKSPMRLTLDGCPSGSKCNANVPGIGFEYRCTVQNIKSIVPQEDRGTLPLYNITYGDATNGLDKNWMIKLNATWFNGVDSDSHPMFVRWDCGLIPALVNYPIEVYNGTVNLLPANSSVKFTPTTNNNTFSPMVDHVINTLPPPPPWFLEAASGLLFTLAGFVEMMSQFKTDWSFTANGEVAPGEGLLAYQMVSQDLARLDTPCSEPVTYLTGILRDLMFRSSVMIAQRNTTDIPGEQLDLHPQNGTATFRGSGLVPSPTGVARMFTDFYGTKSTPIAVYKTNYTFVIIGEALIVLCVLCILPLFWGYWRLGRKVSLAPLEMAQALNTPATVSSNAFQYANGENGQVRGSNADCKELVDILGDVRVQYGEVAPGKLGLAVQDTVTKPTRGVRYQ